MAHAREQVRLAVYNLLNGETAAGSNVHRERVYKFAKDDLPAITISTPLDEIAEDFDTTGGVLLHALNLVVEARVEAASNAFPENDLDDLCAEIEALIGGDPTLSSLVQWVRPSSAETDLDGEQETVVGLATMVFRVQYETPADDPETISG